MDPVRKAVTVRELISQLKQYPQQYEVRAAEAEASPLEVVSVGRDNGVVYLGQRAESLLDEQGG